MCFKIERNTIWYRQEIHQAELWCLGGIGCPSWRQVQFQNCCNNALYKELWDACAGPLVTLPREGERVYYFPQGHIEQLGAPIQQQSEHQMASLNLPSKILCKVINVQCKAEPITDQVYAQIMLLPEPEQIDVISPDPPLPEPERCVVHSFRRILTVSDISSHDHFFVDQKHAEHCLPPLDMSQQLPWQELVATDLNGNKWHFQHIFQGKSNKHLLTTGWSAFVSSKKLVSGDMFIFLRGENGELRVGVRRLMGRKTNILSSATSNQIRHSLLAVASYAISTGSLFCVFYEPRTSRSEFIVSVNKYIEARNHKFCIGMRFLMRFEGEEVPIERINGTIVSMETSPRWPDSEWRCFKVRWDEPSLIVHPERVSPWEMENISSSSQPVPRTKRSRSSSPGAMEISPSSTQPGPRIKQLRSTVFLSQTPDFGMWIFPAEVPGFSNCDLYLSSSSSTNSKTYSSDFRGDSSQASTSPNRVVYVTESAPSVNKDFGMEEDGCPVLSLENESDQHSETANINQSEKLSVISCDTEKLCSKKQITSCAEVRMQGIALGRSIDLTKFKCHEDLIKELENMFEIEGELSGSTKKWLIVYTDADSEMKLVGDYQWEVVCNMVKKILIYRLG
ncbi:Auxin response factor, putative [Ricinus communis]|uniref:Auxin response factor n=2 Tax=Ricinus communis TaxID=3988 RepID=B9SPB5_RICCO|nr:Auxin response factor, putative [Ricinus communis]